MYIVWSYYHTLTDKVTGTTDLRYPEDTATDGDGVGDDRRGSGGGCANDGDGAITDGHMIGLATVHGGVVLRCDGWRPAAAMLPAAVAAYTIAW